MASYIGPSGSFSHMKNLNLDKVFRTIVLKAPLSRADISRETGLNKVTVSNCIRDLIEADIVSEEGIVSSENGRPPMMLMLSKTYGIIIGVEISGISTNFVVSDLRGTILEQAVREDKSYSPKQLVKKIKEIVDDCDKKFKTKNGVVGIGIALPLNYNEKMQEDPNNPIPAWRGVDAESFFAEQFPDIPVAIMNTASAGAIGEIHFGDYDPSTYLAYIHGNWSLKLDLYDGGETYSSDGRFYGKLGKVLIGDGSKCFNDVVSIGSLVDKFYPNTASRLEAVQNILNRQKNGDKEVDAALRKAVDYLAQAIYDVIQMFNPEAICIGGYLGYALNRGYMELLNEKVAALVGQANLKGRVVTASHLGIFNVAFGAVSWIRDNTIEYRFKEY
ncbi:MAG: ROK family transcriptional regulator [Lachnospiraceae bacterium]|nr:ROK family transcriptional regulator [Candidatus Minthocola equi]